MRKAVRLFLIVATLGALIAVIVQRSRPPEPEEIPPVERGATAEDPAPNLMPSVSNLPAMAEQWQRIISKMPPEARKASEERMLEEVRYFVSIQSLPDLERREKMRDRLEGLMNDPVIQAEWADERVQALSNLSPEKRHTLFKKYVRYKKSLQSR